VTNCSLISLLPFNRTIQGDIAHTEGGQETRPLLLLMKATYLLILQQQNHMIRLCTGLKNL